MPAFHRGAIDRARQISHDGVQQRLYADVIQRCPAECRLQLSAQGCGTQDSVDLLGGNVLLFQEGQHDLIVEVNRNEIGDVADLRKSLKSDKDSVLMLIRRGEDTLYVPLKRTG